MLHIAADRFLPAGRDWLDLATGLPARLLIAPAGSRGHQIAWSSRCEVQANLRHPALNALIDFGALDRERVFEAYECGGSVRAGGAAGPRLLRHAVRFLDTHGIALARPMADFALRPAAAGPAAHARPVGIVLQRPTAFDAIADALDEAAPAGACTIRVAGPDHSGLRTLRLLTARAARLRGYVPIAARVLRATRGLATRFRDRHICVLDDGAGDAAGVACFLAQVGAAGGRRHVVLRFDRAEAGGRRAIEVAPMGVRAMTAMVFVDGDLGPEPVDIFDAARQADGRPGLFIAHLGGERACRGHHASVVRETAAAYSAGPSSPEPAGNHTPRRIAGVLLRATRRARKLAADGRHAVAERSLARAVRVLAARGEAAHAARCAIALGRLALDRGRVEEAAAAFERARDLDPESRSGIEATVALAGAWLEDARFVDAEGALRTSQMAVSDIRDEGLEVEIAAALADCLRLQGRAAEALGLPSIKRALAGPTGLTDLHASAARACLAGGELPAALRSARHALAAARASRDARWLATAHLAAAGATAASGDPEAAREHVRDGLVSARSAHLPLLVLRLRIVEIAIESAPAGERRKLARRLETLAPAALTRLLRKEIAAACDERIDPPRRHDVADLESLIELCHGAQDDGRAIEAVCAEVVARLRCATVLVAVSGREPRVLAMCGRHWHGEPLVARRVLASGLGAASDAGREPFEAAEPVRYGGETIGAVAARWVAGASLDPSQASALLRAGALAMAGSVRAVLDRAVPAPAAQGTDLMGASGPARALLDAIARAARAPFPVLIEGESGSGKELVARGVHRLSARRDRRFCPVNCAALTDDLLEAELFGHARGAFTGAVGERAGLFEEADGGTLFLDEIGELSPRAQAKLLRVLQDGEVRRVGENIPRRVDVRIVAATNRRLEEEAAAGRFRADLRFRLDVVRIEVPPLRDRPGDVALLASHFWAEAAARVGSRATLSPEALAALARYDWPGNVRELQNVIAWVAVHSPGRGRVSVAGLPAQIAKAGAPGGGTFETARLEFERRFVRAALATANGRRASAAAALGVSRQGLVKMMRRLGIE